MVLSAAEGAGYRPVLISNRAMMGNMPDGWLLIKSFDYDFWGRRLSPGEDGADDLAHLERTWRRLRYSRLGLLWSAASNLEDVRHYSGGFSLSPRKAAALRRVASVRSTFDLLNAAQVPLDTVVDEAKSPAGRARLLRTQRDMLRAVLSPEARSSTLGAVGPLSAHRAMEAMAGMERDAERTQSYAAGLKSAIEQVPLTADCHIVYATIAYFELRGLMQVLETCPDARRCAHHIVMRRDAYQGYPETFDEQEWQAHSARTAFAMLTGVPGVRLHLYTDTEMLSQQYDRFGVGAFRAGPVPVDVASRGRWQPPTAPDGEDVCILLEADSVELASEDVQRIIEHCASFPDERFKLHIVIPGGIPKRVAHPLLLLRFPANLEAVFCRIEDLDGFEPARLRCLVVAARHGRYDRFILDAFEQGLPVLLDHRHRLCGLLQRRADAYHNAALEPDATILATTLEPGAWRRYRYNDGALLLNLLHVSGALDVRSDSATVIETECQQSATHVRIRFHAPQGIHLTVFFRPQVGADKQMGRVDIPFQGSDRPCSVLIPVPESAGVVALSLCNFTGHAGLPVSSPVLTWLRPAHPPAILPGGGCRCLSWRGMPGTRSPHR